MTYESDIDLKDIVYLVTDSEQLPRMVISIEFTACGGKFYTLNHSIYESRHYRCEISKEKDVLIKLGI